MRIISKIKSILIIFIFAVIATMISSCYPDYGLTVEDFDLVATFKDDAVNFQNYDTYYLPDEIERILDNGVIEINDGEYDQQILSEIVNQMQAYGYTRVSNLQDANLELHVATTSSANFSYYPGYWGGYYGWYYPWYGGYYGGYSYAYTTGSVFITMIDLGQFNEENEVLGAVWAGILNGVLDNSTSANIKSRVIKGIDDMFEQSPYLKQFPQ